MYLLRFIFLFLVICRAKSLFSLGRLETAKNPFKYLEEKKYPYENHTVITEDGYKLLLVRIPCKNKNSCNKNGPPLLFVHGLVSNFYDFLVTGKDTAIGFKAIDEGYDVFLLNTRGNTWSRKHTHLDPDKNEEYWKFSFHEIGVYDMTATIDYITNLTGNTDLSIVAHSQGGSGFLTMASLKPEYNEKVKVAILLAPLSFMTYSKSIVLRIFKKFPQLLHVWVKTFHTTELFSHKSALSRALRLACRPKSLFLPICKGGFGLITGFSTQTNNSMVSAYLTNTPSGCSANQLLHYHQLGYSGKFRQYFMDGKQANFDKYGLTYPPDYNLTAITTPVAIFYGANDYFVSTRDEIQLAKSLPNVVANVLVPYNKTNHLDLLIGKKAKELFTEPALKILNKYNDL